MRLCSIASGSSGNCIYVGDSITNILVDTGISAKRIELGLNKINLSLSNIDGIFITHEHSDHIKGLGVVSRRYKIPIYTTKNTWQEISCKKSLGTIDSDLFNEIMPDNDYNINDITIHPFYTSHDAVEPVCYTFTKENKKISVATDLGCYNNYIKEKLKNSNILFIEANHDIKMLEVGKYPYFLKRRILSNIGHLSNDMSGKLICELLNKDLKHIILGHLSKENNYPELAYESVKIIIEDGIKQLNSDINLTVAKRNDISELFVI